MNDQPKQEKSARLKQIEERKARMAALQARA